MKLSDKVELKKGAWSPEEDEMLIAYIKRYGIWNWSRMPKAAGLSRSGKNCRLRWVNYLRPDLKRGRFSMEEIEAIIKLHESFGNKWSQIAAQLPGRTDNEIKNFWHTHMRKGCKTNTTVPGADYYRPKKIKHEKKRPTHINNSLGYGAEESSVEVSNIIAESTEFPIAESYSPSQDCDVVTEGTENMENFISCGTHGKTLEDVYLPEIDSAIFQELGRAYPAHGLKVQESSYTLNNDKVTSFWVNVLMEATQQRNGVEAILEYHECRCYT